MTDASERVVSVAPWLAVRGSARAVTFYQVAFAAREIYRLGEGETVVARLAVGASEFWVSEEAPEYGDSSPMTLGGSCVRMILSVPDPDAVFARALCEGAVPVCPVTEGHGWRAGKVRDPFGHVWEIARPPEEDTT